MHRSSETVATNFNMPSSTTLSVPNTDIYGLPTPSSEDCLTLDVFVPRGANEGKKGIPVFVWQHGGGFVEGSSSQAVYNPSTFIEETRDITVVTTK